MFRSVKANRNKLLKTTLLLASSLNIKERCVNLAIVRMMMPEIKKRIPANSILLPVISAVISNSSKPSLING